MSLVRLNEELFLLGFELLRERNCLVAITVALSQARFMGVDLRLSCCASSLVILRAFWLHENQDRHSLDRIITTITIITITNDDGISHGRNGR